MKLTEPDRDYRPLVAAGYDAIAGAHTEARTAGGDDALTPLLARLPRGARVLDLGCGGGVPIARRLAEQCDVVGADISRSQIALARKNVPAGQFVLADMTHLSFARGSFDAAVSFYAIFHTPRTEHEAILRRIHEWLRPGGYVLATLAMRDDPDYTEEFFGVEMYWSNFEISHYRELLPSIGFEMLDDQVISHGYAEDAPAETHPLIFARKR
ncbi:MAG: class I SAM-dependent methyltransferase [Dehalococcoidia bacterium]